MKKNKLYTVGMTVLWCVMFSQAMKSWTMGICLGLLMGMSVGLFKSEDNGEKKQ